MATGGIFQLITNDGKQDRMLMATDLLRSRLANITMVRKAQGKPDPTPTLNDIEKTHVLFVNAHFKPFVAIGYEYQATRIATGQPQLGSGVQFSLPQFGEFFYDMVLYVELSPLSATTTTGPSAGDLGYPTNTAGQNYYRLVNKYGMPVADAAVGVANDVVYCDDLGARLLKKISFQVNSNPLDEYTSDTMIFHKQFKVDPRRRVAYERAIGQEVPWIGYQNLGGQQEGIGRPSYGGQLQTPTVVVEDSRQQIQVVNGFQTPKASHGTAKLWIPFKFWFNEDPRLSIPSVSIPYGQRFISVDFAPLTDIASTVPSLYVMQTVTNMGAPMPVDGTLFARAENYLHPFLLSNSLLNPVSITNTYLYINNLFVQPEIHDIYIKKIGFNLVRVHRIQNQTITKTSDNILLNILKWPIETIYVGFRPRRNITPQTVVVVDTDTKWRQGEVQGDTMRFWNKLGIETDWTTRMNHFNVVSLTTTNLSAFNTVNNTRYTTTSPVIDFLGIEAHGIQLYNMYPAEFYNEYLPYRHGAAFLNCPEDPGAYMISFNFYPGSYQPSGHINVSRAREFYIKYTCPSTAVIPGSGVDPLFGDLSCDMLVHAIALNFLLISDGSAVLRYST